ncbi:MAG: D-alanine--D-alanine ligase [Anaerolineaceae bacterium]|nr:D-alanine--D-alanine ligase [Anaerolineaceae bacterium]
MSTKKNIAVIFGGRSGEHEVSLMSARSVLSVLDPAKYNIIEIGITQSGIWLTGEHVVDALEAKSFNHLLPVALLPAPLGGQLYVIKDLQLVPLVKIDIVFPVLHGTFGEDGAIQGLFELADVAYVGCGVLASSVGMDKSLFKDVMRAHQIPVVDSMLFTRYHIHTGINEIMNAIEKSIPYPVFIKPVNMGSSVGITKCSSRSSLMEGLMDAARFDRRVLVERGVNARELEVSVLGNEDPIASVAGEILPAAEFYTYDAKYKDSASKLIIPAELDDETSAKIRRTAINAFKAIDGAGMARVDFLLDRDSGELYVSEINTIPGFTSISMYSKLWEASGILYAELVSRLIDFAEERKLTRDATVHVFDRSKG